MVAPHVVGSRHYEPVDAVVPFLVGVLSPGRGFVHVVDDVTLDVVLRTLDTVADFARYLSAKEEFITSGRLGAAAGEEDLLGYYLRHTDPDGQHTFRLPEAADAVVIDDSFWVGYQTHPDRLRKIEADRPSYAWDQLIEKFTHHLLKGDQYFKSHDSIGEQETALRLMAREPRLSRRALAKALLGVLRRGDDHERFVRLVFPRDQKSPHYMFLSVQHSPKRSYKEYRSVRRYLLESYCLAARLRYGDLGVLVGIATEPHSHKGGRSEDYVAFDCSAWPTELEEEARRRQAELHLLEDTSAPVQFDEPEFPMSRDRSFGKGRHRNLPCPCSSGLKYKRCCGKKSTW